MLQGEKEADAKADNIIKELGDHALTKSHARHLSASRCAEIGLKIENLEDNEELQDAVLSVHHACILTLDATPALKIIENHDGKACVQRITTVVAKPAR